MFDLDKETHLFCGQSQVTLLVDHLYQKLFTWLFTFTTKTYLVSIWLNSLSLSVSAISFPDDWFKSCGQWVTCHLLLVFSWVRSASEIPIAFRFMLFPLSWTIWSFHSLSADLTKWIKLIIDRRGIKMASILKDRER